MPDNSGFIISGNDGGNFNINTGSGSATQHVAGDHRAATLKEIDELIDRLVRESFDQLPAEQVGVVVLEARTLKDLLHGENPDRGRVKRAVDAIAATAASAAPVIEIAHQLTALLTQLLH
jgi:hypothetical protein